MDTTFVSGVAAVVSAILIFVGSAWFILSLLTGARLAYFITASITLGFTFIMGVVWSINPLGPVGQLPEWLPLTIGEDVSDLDFGPASQYPKSPWLPVNEDDTKETEKASSLESAAGDYLEQAIEKGTIDAFEDAGDSLASDDGTRLLEQDGTTYGAVTLKAAPAEEGEEELPAGTKVIVVMEYDPGNVLGKARMITAGTFILFAAHLFGLSRAEKRAKREREEAATGNGETS